MERPHKKLLAWQKAMDLVVLTYDVTRAFPGDEKYGLVNQMRRAAASVPANIAEGSARGSDKEELRFLLVARGSLSELDTFKDLVLRLEFGDRDSLCRMEDVLERVSALVQGLIERKRHAIGYVRDSTEDPLTFS